MSTVAVGTDSRATTGQPVPFISQEKGGSWSRWGFRIGLSVLALLLLSSLALRVVGWNPNTPNYGNTLAAPSLAHLFGTDALGRDVFGRTVYASLTDLEVGFFSTIVPWFVGLALGTIVGYRGGWLDAITMRIVDVILAVPLLVLVIAIVAIYGPGLTGVYVGLIVTGIPWFLRLARSEMLVLREQQFILAARTLGFSMRRILVKHAVPHLLRTSLVFFLANMVGNIILLSSLSYLGLGVQPPHPEWGAIIADGQQYLLTSWWISTLPGLFVVVAGVALYVTGEALADRLHVRTGGLA